MNANALLALYFREHWHSIRQAPDRLG